MKKFIINIFLFLYIITLISCSSKPVWEGVFDYYPEKPEPGDEVTIFYNADSTKLSSYDKIEMTAYLYSTKLDDAVGVEMMKVKNGWEGKIKTTEETRGVIIKFKNDDNIDNNDKKGYVIHLYDGDKTIPGSVAGLGAAVLNWGSYYIDLERDFELAMKYLEEDFSANPGIKDEYLNAYLLTYSQLHPETTDSLAKRELSDLEKKENLSEDNLTVLMDWYERTGDQGKSDKYKNMLSEKFPQNEAVQRQRYEEIQNEFDIVKKKELADKFYKDFPESKYSQPAYDMVAIYYRDNKLYNEALEFFKSNNDRTTLFRFYSVNQRIYKENADSNIALEIAKLGVQRAEKELSNPSGKKPEYLTEKEWKEETEYYAGLNYFSYGKALYLTGNKKDAEANLEKAAKLTKNEEGEINELYVTVVYENGDKSKTKRIIEDYIKEGKSTTAMIDVLKEVYTSEKGSDEGFENYLSQFKSVAFKELEDKFKSEMINKPAPGFTLEDFDGKKVSLADLKGKTVIIDFWATWCGPCLQSFPGMKKAVEKYSDNENVKFLFVNSWERVEDKKNNAKDFIKKNNYPFHILIDYDNKVIGDFGVSGIPTKFIIDKTGSIRFMSVGFSGNVDQLADEISVMIDLLN
ncbi:MAG: TlpA disulfide reductase family protein [Ignavibacteria bacterium]|nr:TlpA disulfide reductase family protein [Ignavibacteria bacterium]